MGCRRKSYFLESMCSDFARDFVSVNVLLYGAKGSHNHRDCCCFELLHSLNLDFQVFIFIKFFRGCDRGFGLEGYNHVNEKAMSFLFFSTMSGLLAAMVQGSQRPGPGCSKPG